VCPLTLSLSKGERGPLMVRQAHHERHLYPLILSLSKGERGPLMVRQTHHERSSQTARPAWPPLAGAR
jgi:hypothetical protein